MNTYSRSNRGDRDPLRELAAAFAEERANTAQLLACIAEFDARRLYLSAGHPSIHSYCVHELHFSEEDAFERVRVARTARQFPAIFDALFEGRLHLSGVFSLAPHLTPENADELLCAAAHKNLSEIERLLAERFPQPGLPTRAEAIPPPPSPGPADRTVRGDS